MGFFTKKEKTAEEFETEKQEAEEKKQAIEAEEAEEEKQRIEDEKEKEQRIENEKEEQERDEYLEKIGEQDYLICPYCDKKIDDDTALCIVNVDNNDNDLNMIGCPHCKKILGIVKY